MTNTVISLILVTFGLGFMSASLLACYGADLKKLRILSIVITWIAILIAWALTTSN